MAERPSGDDAGSIPAGESAACGSKAGFDSYDAENFVLPATDEAICYDHMQRALHFMKIELT